ncbi:LysM peptidoglycan-binding domain-containing protein [Deinococcus sp. HMF7620]|uniref:LysM peptidoglycan-binding domain-containing protein n=1 Tax=Deinococcus arboris TaxID=2682977 RepID=A0A7C9LJ80_9DEIO|nr:LysM peptidoglycan-binding domain-containing protein [Deinococcus arboris]MVN85698.1 LysM peptidoglycan-binding domain-containing protein [Deinococcus arboris]
MGKQLVGGRRSLWALGAALALALGAADARTYTVQAGDTLYAVARRVGTSVETLQRLNSLSGAALRPGQVLQLPAAPGAGQATAPQVTAAPPAARAAAIPAVAAPLPGSPRPDPAQVTGPRAWTAAPPATVVSFIGWALTDLGLPVGDEAPIRTYLPGLSFSYQTYNNCGPSALSSVLGFYRVKIGQDVIQRTARPGGGYMQISAIAPELSKFGLNTLTVRQARLSQVKRLLALGIPVIVLQWFERTGQVPHFRVVRGYDDQAGLVWVSDSMVGPLAYMSYRSFDVLWNTQGRQMFPVYPKGYDALVRRLVGHS